MIKSRLALQCELEQILGSKNVYFQPMETLKMKYPCIVYSLMNIPDKNANNKPYIRDYTYRVTLIHSDPDNCIVDKLMNFPYTSFDRHFATQGLNHYVFTITYKFEKETI